MLEMILEKWEYILTPSAFVTILGLGARFFRHGRLVSWAIAPTERDIYRRSMEAITWERDELQTRFDRQRMDLEAERKNLDSCREQYDALRLECSHRETGPTLNTQ